MKQISNNFFGRKKTCTKNINGILMQKNFAKVCYLKSNNSFISISKALAILLRTEILVLTFPRSMRPIWEISSSDLYESSSWVKPFSVLILFRLKPSFSIITSSLKYFTGKLALF